MKYAVACKMIVPVMRLPNHLSERIDELLYGMRVEILRKVDEEWYYIRSHYDYEGYVESNHLKENDYKLDYWWSMNKLVVIQSFADVLEEASIKSPVIKTLVRGSIVEQLEESDSNGFTKINLFSGRYGYIKENFLITYLPQIPEEEILRQQLVYYALSYMGTQYRWGGRSTMGIDCSGLCQMAYMLNGIIIYRDSIMVEGFPIKPIPMEDMNLGDLLYFPGHIAMYIGDDSYVHATARNGSDGVVINSLNPRAINYRKDLAESLYAVGSYFSS